MGANTRNGVCVVGSIHMDVAATAERLPARGESLIGQSGHVRPGGKAGNQAVQAARHGAQTFFIGRVGQDIFGERLRQALADAGVDTTYLTVDADAVTGFSPVLTGADGEYASIILPGASGTLGPVDIDTASEAFVRSAVLLLQGEIAISVSAYAAELAQSQGCVVIFNASPAPTDPAAIPDALWSAVTILLVNGAEAERLSGVAVTDIGSAMAASSTLRQRLGMPAVIVTLGGDGVVVLDEQGPRHVPAWRVPVVETIGAGDAFAGVLASEVASGTSLDEALPPALAAGALAVTRPGAYDALATGAEIRAFLRERQNVWDGAWRY